MYTNLKGRKGTSLQNFRRLEIDRCVIAIKINEVFPMNDVDDDD